MMQIFASHKQENNSFEDVKSIKNSVLSTSQQQQYQVLIGDDGSSTSCSTTHSDLQQSRQSSVEESSQYECSDINCTSTHPNVNLIVYIIFYMIMMIFGACVFTLIEQPAEMQLRDQLIRRQQAFLAKHQCVDCESMNLMID